MNRSPIFFRGRVARRIADGKKPSRGGWAFLQESGLAPVYGVTDCVEWLPCGTQAIAVGLGSLVGYGVA